MAAHTTIVSFYAARDAAHGLTTAAACCAAKIPRAVRPMDDDFDRPHQFLPWFLMDQLAAQHPNRVLYVQAGTKPKAGVLEEIAEIGPADILLVENASREIDIRAMLVGNTDYARLFVEAWIEYNDERPTASIEEGLAEMVQRYRYSMNIRRSPLQLLHHRSVAGRISHHGNPKDPHQPDHAGVVQPTQGSAAGRPGVSDHPHLSEDFWPRPSAGLE